MCRSIAPALVLLIACDGGGLLVRDAANGSADAALATSCADPIATTALATVNLSGVVADGTFAGSGNTLVGATIAAFGTGTSATSETGGIYQIAADTGGLPIEYMQLSNTGYEDTRYFPRAPMAKTTALPRLPLFTTADAGAFATTFGVTQDAGKGIAIVVVSTCQGSLVADATVTAGTSMVKYLHADNTTTGTATDATGLAIIFNLTAGSAVIDAQATSLQFHAHPITADPAYLTITTIAEP